MVKTDIGIITDAVEETLGVAAAAVRGRSLHQQRAAAFRRGAGIGHRAGLLYSAAHRYRRQQRNADHLDAGALDGAGRSTAARYGAGDPQRGIDLISDCLNAGAGGLPARLDDGHRHGNHADRQPDAGMHYPVERDCLVGHPDGA